MNVNEYNVHETIIFISKFCEFKLCVYNFPMGKVFSFLQVNQQ